MLRSQIRSAFESAAAASCAVGGARNAAPVERLKRSLLLMDRLAGSSKYAVSKYCGSGGGAVGVARACLLPAGGANSVRHPASERIVCLSLLDNQDRRSSSPAGCLQLRHQSTAAAMHRSSEIAEVR